MSFDDDFVDVSSDGRDPERFDSCCFSFASEFSLYKAFLFSVPILFTFILLFLFYFFFLRPRRVDWSSIRMRTSLHLNINNNNDFSTAEMGLRKEFREMLPVIIYKESFSIRETQCSVCLSDYQAEDKLQQIPACGHTFHMECIDHWLTTHSTCPLCRLSLLSIPRASSELPNTWSGSRQRSSNVENSHVHQGHEETASRGQLSESGVRDERYLPNNANGMENSSQSADRDKKLGDASRKIDDCESSDRKP